MRRDQRLVEWQPILRDTMDVQRKGSLKLSFHYAEQTTYRAFVLNGAGS